MRVSFIDIALCTNWDVNFPTPTFDKKAPKEREDKPEYLPTPEQIQDECRRIQSTWSDTQRLTRKA